MQFASARFAVFFLVVATVAWTVPERVRKPWLVLASLVFYAAADPRWLVVLGAVAGIGWIGGALLDRAPSRGAVAAAAIAGCLGILGLFKYWEFGRANLDAALAALGLSSPIGFLEPGLPIGVSFYTFQTIAFLAERHRGAIQQPPALDYALYVAFFPKLLIGPLVRPDTMLAQIARPPAEIPDFSLAVALLATGWLKKAIVSTYLGEMLVDRAFSSPGGCSSVELLVACYGYSIQLVCDFSGYTDLARGLALLLGYRLPENFASPYLATDLAEFWRRWHMTFSAWLRDYVFIPLGGSRGGFWRTQRNLLITMVLGGLWHGASWSFVLWGGLHGVLLVLLRITRKTRKWLGIGDPGPVGLAVGWLWTFHAVVFARILFRTADLAVAGTFVRGLAAGTTRGDGFPPGVIVAIALGFLLDAAGPRLPAALASLHERIPWVARPFAWTGLTLVALGLLPDAIPPYIYFGF